MSDSREIRDGAPVALQLRADLVPHRAARAVEDGNGPLEVERANGTWARVVYGEIYNSTVALTLEVGDDYRTEQWPATSVVWVRWGLGTSQEWVPAHDVRVGDVVHNLGEQGVPWKVREVTDRPGAGQARGTTWVVLTGDNDEGYYTRWYGGDTQYLAGINEPVAVSWPRPEEVERHD